MSHAPQHKRSPAAGWWIAALVVLFFGWIFWQATKVTSRGQMSPFDLVLSDLNGQDFALRDLKGKVAIVDFWATWCGPCRQEIPGFVNLHKHYADQGVAIVGIAMESGTAEQVRQFAQSFGINYRLVMGSAEAVAAFGGLEGYPTTFIFDRQGKLVKRHVGYRPPGVFEDEILTLLQRN